MPSPPREPPPPAWREAARLAVNTRAIPGETKLYPPLSTASTPLHPPQSTASTPRHPPPPTVSTPRYPPPPTASNPGKTPTPPASTPRHPPTLLPPAKRLRPNPASPTRHPSSITQPIPSPPRILNLRRPAPLPRPPAPPAASTPPRTIPRASTPLVRPSPLAGRGVAAPSGSPSSIVRIPPAPPRTVPPAAKVVESTDDPASAAVVSHFALYEPRVRIAGETTWLLCKLCATHGNSLRKAGYIKGFRDGATSLGLKQVHTHLANVHRLPWRQYLSLSRPDRHSFFASSLELPMPAVFERRAIDLQFGDAAGKLSKLSSTRRIDFRKNLAYQALSVEMQACLRAIAVMPKSHPVPPLSAEDLAEKKLFVELGQLAARRDLRTGALQWLGCRFCVRFRKDAWHAVFRPDDRDGVVKHLVEQHGSLWREYQAKPPEEKAGFFGEMLPNGENFSIFDTEIARRLKESFARQEAAAVKRVIEGQREIEACKEAASAKSVDDRPRVTEDQVHAAIQAEEAFRREREKKQEKVAEERKRKEQEEEQRRQEANIMAFRLQTLSSRFPGMTDVLDSISDCVRNGVLSDVAARPVGEKLYTGLKYMCPLTFYRGVVVAKNRSWGFPVRRPPGYVVPYDDQLPTTAASLPGMVLFYLLRGVPMDVTAGLLCDAEVALHGEADNVLEDVIWDIGNAVCAEGLEAVRNNVRLCKRNWVMVVGLVACGELGGDGVEAVLSVVSGKKDVDWEHLVSLRSASGAGKAVAGVLECVVDDWRERLVGVKSAFFRTGANEKKRIEEDVVQELRNAVGNPKLPVVARNDSAAMAELPPGCLRGITALKMADMIDGSRERFLNSVNEMKREYRHKLILKSVKSLRERGEEVLVDVNCERPLLAAEAKTGPDGASILRGLSIVWGARLPVREEAGRVGVCFGTDVGTGPVDVCAERVFWARTLVKRWQLGMDQWSTVWMNGFPDTEYLAPEGIRSVE